MGVVSYFLTIINKGYLLYKTIFIWEAVYLLYFVPVLRTIVHALICNKKKATSNKRIRKLQ